MLNLFHNLFTYLTSLVSFCRLSFSPQITEGVVVKRKKRLGTIYIWAATSAFITPLACATSHNNEKAKNAIPNPPNIAKIWNTRDTLKTKNGAKSTRRMPKISATSSIIISLPPKLSNNIIAPVCGFVNRLDNYFVNLYEIFINPNSARFEV